MADPLERLLARVPAQSRKAKHPWVTLSYAQSLDGSIGTSSRKPLPLSGPEALAVTHRLRAAHDAILVGIGTVIADNPLLTVRHADGDHPQPVILDSHLRIPREASLWSHPKPPLIACVAAANSLLKLELESAGGRVLSLPSGAYGRVSLPALLDRLGQLGVESLIVEGGSEVITSFVRERLADALVITIAPVLVGGLRAPQDLGSSHLRPLPRLQDPDWAEFGSDILVWGEIGWPAE